MPLLDLVCIESWTGAVGAGGTEEGIGIGIGGFGDVDIGRSGVVEEGMGGDRLGADWGVTMGAEERGRITSEGSEVIGTWEEGEI